MEQQPLFRSVISKVLTPIGLYLSMVLCSGNPAEEAGILDFASDIRPILSDKCFACHGPDSNKRKAGLRLDDRSAVFSHQSDGKPLINPEKPSSSSLLDRVLSKDPDLQMPPPEANKELSAAETQKLITWIRQGASWGEHWAFEPISKTNPPSDPSFSEVTAPIDAFIRSRLSKEGLSPSQRATSDVLIRRLALDLTGLPPDRAEVEAFRSNPSAENYERFVDKYLESQRYGEHMARYWLDAARYGDTHGLHLDNYREMWPYRDWVVRAFNENKPFDEFIVEQLAGDLLPDPTQDQLVATGFNRCHVTTGEGGSIKEEVYVRNVIDRVVTTGTVFMGLTFECTRCHDHKFDPLTMTDFYSMFAFFNNLDGPAMDGNRKDHAPVIKVPSDEENNILRNLSSQITRLESRLKGDWNEIDRAQKAWEEELERQSLATANGKAPLSMSNWHHIGPFNDAERYLRKNRQHGPEGKPVDLAAELKTTNGEIRKWKERADYQDGKIHNDLPGETVANFLYRTIESPRSMALNVSLGSGDGLKVFLNGKEIHNNVTIREVDADQEQVTLELVKGTNEILVKILNFGGKSGFYFKSDSEVLLLPKPIYATLFKADGSSEEKDVSSLRDYYRNQISDNDELRRTIGELKQRREEHAELDRRIPTTMVWRERKEPREAFILNRGEYDQKGETVSAATPGILPQFPADYPRNRLGLAQWLTSSDHPLTARVTVNRFWQQIFGLGLVKTAEDFGSQGTPPTHPELLDWLSYRFIQEGWNVKRLMKKMVMSATYQQTAKVTETLLEIDPANRLLARGVRLRLDAETLRDQALMLGGLLNGKIGGPGVKPPQPDGLWFAVGFSGSDTVRFKADQGSSKVHRRTLYTFLKRTSPPPQMSTFDAPPRESCTVRRERTNTPMQALLLMNDPQYVEAAKGLAILCFKESSGEPRDVAKLMLERCTGREPGDKEVEELVAIFENEASHYRDHPKNADALVGIGESRPLSEPISSDALAAWIVVANMVLNLDEVIMKN